MENKILTHPAAKPHLMENKFLTHPEIPEHIWGHREFEREHDQRLMEAVELIDDGEIFRYIYFLQAAFSQFAGSPGFSENKEEYTQCYTALIRILTRIQEAQAILEKNMAAWNAVKSGADR